MPTKPLSGKILIVVDPAQEQPLALERALITAKLVTANSPTDTSIPPPHILMAVDRPFGRSC